MGTVGERRPIVRFQQEADHPADEFTRPGGQAGRYAGMDPGRLPLARESATVWGGRGADDGRLVPVRAQVWRAQVGRVPLYLLDTDVDGNPDGARGITDRLYGGDRRHRCCPGSLRRQLRCLPLVSTD